MPSPLTPGDAYQLTDSFRVGANLEQTWKFFSSAGNLPRITPPWLGFQIHTPESVVIQKDVIFDYTIRWMKFPVRWRTRIIEWDPPRRFVDLQERGPYTLWWHEHAFEPEGDGVRCRDRVLYRLPMGLVGRVTHALIVRNQLRQIFRFRRGAIGQSLGGIEPLQEDIDVGEILIRP